MKKKRNNIICFIPAKKNSQDLKNKNLKKLNNLSLFELAILGAKKSQFINKIYLSSDSNEILKKAKKYKIDVIKRKKSLSTNSSSANSVILDFLNNYFNNQDKNTIVVYLQPTSPFRNNSHIDQAINHFLNSNFRSVISVTENKNFFKSFYKNKETLTPFFNDKLITNNRQNLKKIYSPNGAIYIFYASDFIKRKKLTFKNSGYYLMKKIDSIDIDDNEDYNLAKFLSKKYLKFKK